MIILFPKLNSTFTVYCCWYEFSKWIFTGTMKASMVCLYPPLWLYLLPYSLHSEFQSKWFSLGPFIYHVPFHTPSCLCLDLSFLPFHLVILTHSSDLKVSLPQVNSPFIGTLCSIYLFHSTFQSWIFSVLWSEYFCLLY